MALCMAAMLKGQKSHFGHVTSCELTHFKKMVPV